MPRTPHLAALFACLLFANLVASLYAEETKRVPWTGSRIHGSPEPPLPYVVENAFPRLEFKSCLDIASTPSMDRLFVVEQGGRIFSFPNRPEVAAADLVVDLKREIPALESVYAFTFHPRFAENRFVYVCYVTESRQPDGTRIARFRMNESDPPTLDAASETTIITWLSGGHNGCCLKFGPDGCLYISSGDGEGNPPDVLRAGQDVTNLLCSILRIDVDHPEEGRNYRIPADNPFVSLAGARGEIWAYGLRNPWRMSFDEKTGDLWVGDVGWELWEMLHRVERGGNYGWAVMEGRQTINPDWQRGPTPILAPTIDHPHSESSSITDGLSYYGKRLPDLAGCHVYGDYDTGKIWGFRYVDGRVVDHRALADTTLRIVGFGADREGECYLLDHVAGTIHRLVENPRRAEPGDFPRRLSETGLFVSLSSLQPAPGVVPYEINAPMWADHARSERVVAVPGVDAIELRPENSAYPTDTVLAKTLSLQMREGDPGSMRRVETQILHFDGIDWLTYSYRWNDEQTDAELVSAEGATQVLEVMDAEAPEGVRRQAWTFSGRGECQRCHNKWAGPPLAFHKSQLSRLTTDAERSDSLRTLAELGVVGGDVKPDEATRLVDPHDESADLSRRARSYLHANCAHCHRQNAGGSVLAQMQYGLPLPDANLVNHVPSQGTFGIADGRVITPGDPYRSVLLYRMAKRGGGRMPHVGSSEVDLRGVALVHDWIRTMETGAVEYDPASVLEQQVRHLRGGIADEEVPAAVDRLLKSTPGALLAVHSLEVDAWPATRRAELLRRATRHPEVSVRDLFERFLPANQRAERLGATIRPEQILDLVGDAARGRALFHEQANMTCRNCHRVGATGKQVGPELTTIASKYDRQQLLESLLEPSRRIDPVYVTHVVQVEDGRSLTGVVVERTAERLTLRDAQDVVTVIPLASIEEQTQQPQSLMPEGLLRDLTAQQAADLLEFLTTLK